MEAFPEATERVGAPPFSGGARLQGWALAGVLAGLMLALLISALDQTIVGTALPKIIGDLHGFDRYTWVVTAYLLASTTMIPIIGKLSDQFGRKWLLMVGIIIFLAGSALSGASQTMNQLIIFRGLQGLGAGFLMSLTFTLVGDIFPPAERARWQGLFMSVFALASVIGPALGGWITDNATWRWVFYVNLPIGALALVVLFIWLPMNISVRSTRYTGWAAVRRIDFAGAFTAAGATVCLLLGLTWGGVTYPWNSAQVISMLSAAGALYAAFFVAERLAVEPILPLDLFRNQVFAAGALLSLAVGAALFTMAIYLPLFIQAVLGQTATSSGAAITPLMLTMAISGALIGQLIARIGRYQALSILGAIIMTFGIFLLWRMDVSTSLGEVTRNMIVVGVGLGMLMPVLNLAVQNAIPRHRLGVGTGAVTYLRSAGSTIGTALLGTVVNNSVATELTRRLPAAAKGLPAQAVAAATNQQVLVNPSYEHTLVARATQEATRRAVAQAAAQVPPGPQHNQIVAAITPRVVAQVTAQVTHLFHQIFAATQQALAAGIQHAFALSLGISAAVILITFFLKDVPLTRRFAEVPATQPAARQPERTRALAGLTLALMATEAQRADADPHLLATLASLADGQYPHLQSEAERGRAIARDLLEPLAATALLTAYSGRARNHHPGPEGPTSPALDGQGSL
jgi:EmrB/QacA subfamily drug resistance transporter